MGTRTLKKGISRREYARRRGVSEGAIRKRISDGSIKKAVRKDGTIDADLADQMLATSTTTGRFAVGDLSEARRRKLAASYALLQDEVEAFAASIVPGDEAYVVIKAAHSFAAERFYAIAPTIATQLAGKLPVEAAAIVQDAVNDALTELSHAADDLAEREARKDGGTPLANMTAVELATLKENLLSEQMELRHALNRGAMLKADDLEAKVCHQLSIVRNNVLGLHHASATQYEHTSSTEALSIITRDIGNILRELICEWFTADDLAGCRMRVMAHYEAVQSR